MSREIGMYAHLDDNNPFQVKVSMPALAKMLIDLSYGEHRLLSELVIQRRAHPNYEKYTEFREHTEALAKLIEKDGYY